MKSVFGLVIFMMAFSSIAFARSERVINVKSVQSAINKENQNWIAKDSWLNQMSKEEVTRMMGLKELPVGDLDFWSTNAKSKQVQPTSIDWRNKDGMNWLGPVMNQGNCGSCVAFSAVATLEASMAIAYGSPWLRPTFSPAQLFSCGGGACEYGWWPEDAARVLQQDGIVDEACLPYTSGSTGEDQMCSQACLNSNSRITKIDGFTTPTRWGGSVDAIKEALKSGPLMTTLRVFSDFLVYSGGVYKHVTGPAVGGHAVSLVGYDDAKQAWLIRNSWGTEWGERGFAWVSWSDTSGVGSSTWAFTINPSSTVLTIGAPSDREVVTGKYELKALGTVGKAELVQFHLKGPGGEELKPLPCRAKKANGCSVKVRTKKLPEGRYEIYVTNSVGIKSQVREFFVINSKPKMSLSFAAIPGIDLTQPLKGRTEFDITADFTPIPIQHLEFRVVNSSGQIVARKTNNYVLEKMRMGWRTVTVPNGEYKIYFHGESVYKDKVYSTDSNVFSVTVNN